MMNTLKDRLDQIVESNQNISQSTERLADEVGLLSDRLNVAQDTIKQLNKAQRTLRLTQRALMVVVTLLLTAFIVLGFLTWRSYNNSDRIDGLSGDLTVSQCQTTGFFLGLAQSPEEQEEPRTKAEDKQLKEFLETYTKAYESLNCEQVLKEEARQTTP
jgi:hypothetical protein